MGTQQQQRPQQSGQQGMQQQGVGRKGFGVQLILLILHGPTPFQCPVHDSLSYHNRSAISIKKENFPPVGQTRAPFFQAPPFLFERAFRAAHSVCARRPFFDKLFFPMV